MRVSLVLPFLVVAAQVLCSQTVAIRNVTVIDSEGARPGMNVVISGSRIASLNGPAPAGATVLDGKGKYLIPALWDMHVHLWEKDPMANLYVANGVLGVRDMGSDLAKTRKLRDDIVAGRVLGPRIYTSGPVIDGPNSAMRQAPVLEAGNPEEARRAVDVVEKSSGDFVKILSGLSYDSYQAVAQRARVIRMPFAGHLPDTVTALEAIDARQKSIEHMFGIAIACSPLEPTLRQQRAEAMTKHDTAALAEIQRRVYESFSAGAANTLFHRMARFGVWQTPTLTLWQRMSLIDMDRLATAPELKYVPGKIRAEWEDPRKAVAKASSERRAALQRDYDFHQKLVKVMAGSGMGVLAGTDTGDPWVVPGFALHDELQAMVKAGVPPLEALGTATIGPARYFDIEASHGTVAKGKIADLVLLDGDPLADIANTRRIHAVIYNGRVLNRKCLDGLLENKASGCPAVPLTVSRLAPPAPAKSGKSVRGTRRATSKK